TPTATQIATAVPAEGTSGRIQLWTSTGLVTSPCDFLVPPPAYTVAQIDVPNSTRMGSPSNAGTPGSVTVSSPSLVGLTLFDGTPGRRACVTIDPSHFTGGWVSTGLALYDGNGTQLWGANCLGCPR